MKIRLFFCGIALWCGLLALPSTRLAQAETPFKFGTVDVQRAINEVSEGRAAQAALKREYDAKQHELETLQRELGALQQSMEKNHTVLSADALQKQENEYRQKYAELTQKNATYKIEMDRKEAASTGAIIKVMQGVVERLGKERGFSVVLEKSHGAVLYAPAEIDLTADVIKAYNNLPASARKAK